MRPDWFQIFPERLLGHSWHSCDLVRLSLAAPYQTQEYPGRAEEQGKPIGRLEGCQVTQRLHPQLILIHFVCHSHPGSLLPPSSPEGQTALVSVKRTSRQDTQIHWHFCNMRQRIYFLNLRDMLHLQNEAHSSGYWPLSMSPIIRVHPIYPQADVILRAARILQTGGLVAFPTETVYGLGANALEAYAVEKIFQVKRRPNYNPLIVHASGVEAAQRLVRVWPAVAEKLGKTFWPGPLTLVLPKRPEVPDIVTAGLDSVAVRVPDHPVALSLLELSELPVAAPSANRSTQLSPTTAQHVEKSLGEEVDLILDGGATILGIESTVIDLSGSRPALLRPGIISLQELQSIIGEIDIRPNTSQDTAPRLSPGMLDRHYAPRASMLLFDPERVSGVRDLIEKVRAEGGSVGALLLTSPNLPLNHPIPMPHSSLSYARLLYAALHSLDDLGCALILVENVPESPAWAAISDRLTRASRQG